MPFVLPSHLRGRMLALALVSVLAAAACTPGGTPTADPASESESAEDVTGSPSPPAPTTSTPTAAPTATPAPTATSTASPSESPATGSGNAASADLPPIPPAVRGVYSHIYTFWSDKWFDLVDLVDTTEVNAIVVDVKDEAGTLLWDIDHPLATAGGGADWRDDFDGFPERLQELKDAGGWAIARIACFKDTLVADARPDLAVQDQSGATWKAHKDFSWLNPYRDEAGQWCIDVGKAALEAGFDEVQFDYIRFPNGGDGDTSQIRLPGVPDDRPREQWHHSDEITQFLARASEQVHEAGGYVSADLFGLVSYDFTWDAQGTGQVVERIGEHVDFISPMVYPSHYGSGNYGLRPHPIEYPYETVWNAMQEMRMRLQGLHARVRPWLEDFPAPWMGHPEHSPQHVSEQIRATHENGIEGWMLWNAANTYTEQVLEAGETRLRAAEDFVPPARTANPDAPPGDQEREWSGMPSCDPYPGILQIAEGNLAGSTPGEPALGADDPRLCAGVPDGQEAEVRWQDRAVTSSASEPASSGSDDADATSG